jgi:A/G-specific adenine glycosylase
MARKPAPTPAPTPVLPTARWKRSLARQLTAWYRRHRRDLPWRRTHDPYPIWVSEIMLQQTQVATVVPYFLRFMAMFPTVQALARADESDVLRQWEGLGYYRRARQLHRAARAVVDEHAGQFPCTLETIGHLPGVGRYTAGAIASIAFDAPAAILEANTVRLFSRLVGFEGDPASGAGRRFLWELAEAVLPPRNCRDFNSALMDLGSLVCTPRNPGCEHCPLSDLCVSFARGQQEQIPRSRPKAPSEAVREAAVVVWHNDKVLLRRRTAGERWAGLWDFLRFEISSRRGAASNEELLDKIRQQSGLAVRPPERIATLKHGVTRFRITLDCYVARCRAGRAKLVAGQWQWVEPDELENFPLSVTGRKLGRLLTGAGQRPTGR